MSACARVSKSNIGSFWRSSAKTKAMRSTADPTSDQTTTLEVQPSAVERIIAKTSAAKPPEKVTKPSQSGLVAAGLLDSSTLRRVTMSASTPIGTFTKKIQRQPMPLVMRPPRTGPTATATPVTEPKTPKATPRSRPWKALAKRASDVANMIAPPMPWKPRARMRKSGPVAAPQRSEPNVNETMPTAKTMRRPNRSAREPDVRRSAASVRA